MNTLLRLMVSVWLLMLGAAGQSVSANASVLPSVLRSYGYGGQTHTRIVYDSTPLAAFDYDSASTPASNENGNRTVATGGISVNLAQFEAAKTGPYRGGPHRDEGTNRRWARLTSYA